MQTKQEWLASFSKPSRFVQVTTHDGALVGRTNQYAVLSEKRDAANAPETASKVDRNGIHRIIDWVTIRYVFFYFKLVSQPEILTSEDLLLNLVSSVETIT